MVLAERNCYDLSTTSIPYPTCTTSSRRGRGKRVRNEGVKLSLGRREWDADVLFSFVFVPHQPLCF